MSTIQYAELSLTLIHICMFLFFFSNEKKKSSELVCVIIILHSRYRLGKPNDTTSAQHDIPLFIPTFYTIELVWAKC